MENDVFTGGLDMMSGVTDEHYLYQQLLGDENIGKLLDNYTNVALTILKFQIAGLQSRSQTSLRVRRYL